MTRILSILLSVALALLGGCALLPVEGVGRPVSWDRLDGWTQDRHAEAWPALLASCSALAKTPDWRDLCAEAIRAAAPTDAQARAFFERWFQARPVSRGWRGRRGLITGYYEPLLLGQRSPDDRFRFPLYRRPPDLVRVELDELYPQLAGKTVRGRLQGRRVVPYFSRERIDADNRPLAGQELLWVDDPVALFFLHIQGSGRVQLANGSVVGVGYADQNGHRYVAIGRSLVQMGELELEDVNLFTIRQWLREHPDRAEAVLNKNPSYIFFRERDASDQGPIGSLGVPLHAERSAAVDQQVISLGVPLWLETTLPDGSPYRRVVFAQDTGGAVRGTVRADLFWGHGPRAEKMAGTMNQRGRLYALTPKFPSRAPTAHRSPLFASPAATSSHSRR